MGAAGAAVAAGVAEPIAPCHSSVSVAPSTIGGVRVTIHPACRYLADEIARLEATKEPVAGLAGHEKWAALRRNGEIQAEINQVKEQLEQCQLAHTPGYETDVA